MENNNKFNKGKTLMFFSVLLFLGGIYLFAKAYSYKHHLSMMFYILLIVCLIIILIIILIKRLNYDLRQIIKLIIRSIVLTLKLNLIGFIILYFTSGPIMCKPCLEGYECHCSTVFETLSSGLIYTIPAVFLLVLLFNLIIKKIRS